MTSCKHTSVHTVSGARNKPYDGRIVATLALVLSSGAENTTENTLASQKQDAWHECERACADHLVSHIRSCLCCPHKTLLFTLGCGFNLPRRCDLACSCARACMLYTCERHEPGCVPFNMLTPTMYMYQMATGENNLKRWQHTLLYASGLRLLAHHDHGVHPQRAERAETAPWQSQPFCLRWRQRLRLQNRRCSSLHTRRQGLHVRRQYRKDVRRPHTPGAVL